MRDDRKAREYYQAFLDLSPTASDALGLDKLFFVPQPHPRDRRAVARGS
jgi:hypothetical protein